MSVTIDAHRDPAAIRVAPILLEVAALEPAAVYTKLSTRAEGLTSAQAATLLAKHGRTSSRGTSAGLPALLWRAVLNPLVILLAVLATVSFATGDTRAAGDGPDDRAERRPEADPGGQGRQRGGEAQGDDLGDGDRDARWHAAGDPISQLVPGDVVQLAAGDMIPGDVRIVQAKDLFVIQGSLTGESFPVEKFGSRRTPRRPRAASN